MGKTRCGIFLLITIAIIFLTFGISTDWKFTCTNENDMSFKKCSEQYPFVSDELDCGTINEKIEQISDLDKTIESYVNEMENSGKADSISVFFRDLDSRQWFGVNENIDFYPASLAKLPLAIMFYKTAEVNKKILEVQLPISLEDISLNDGQHFKPSENLEAGKSYTIRELVKRTLTYSDNVPVNALMNASESFRTPVLADLGIYIAPQNDEETGTWTITAKNYSNLFRILYNSSYLRPEYSNEILSSLSKSTFKNGLAAGIPEEIKISHKFGEISHVDEKTNSSISILNDCGIIYKKDNPYILCIMTRGTDYETLQDIVKNISKKVYDY